jgi:hypothetical protein
MSKSAPEVAEPRGSPSHCYNQQSLEGTHEGLAGEPAAELQKVIPDFFLQERIADRSGAGLLRCFVPT